MSHFLRLVYEEILLLSDVIFRGDHILLLIEYRALLLFDAVLHCNLKVTGRCDSWHRLFSQEPGCKI